MYLRRIKYKDRIYYYLTRKQAGSNQEDRLATLGSLTNPTPNQELQLITRWLLTLLGGSEASTQKSLGTEKQVTASRLSEYGKNFDLDKCLAELRAIYVKYGAITKTILDKQARPNGDLSWGVQTVLANLKRRELSLKKVFEAIRKNRSESIRTVPTSVENYL